MFPSKKLNIVSLVFCIIAVILGFVGLSWNLIYNFHSWHNYIFRENLYYEGVIGSYVIVLSCFFVFWFVYLFLHKKTNNKVSSIISYVSFGVFNLAALAAIALVIGDSLTYKRDFNDIRLDNQLASENSDKFHESIDSIIARSTNHDLYVQYGPDDYMMLAARSGYAPAQNFIGVYFHEQAKKINDREYGYDNWDVSSTYYCKEELDRATYWWLKAAKQNNEVAQENLGRLWMKEVLGNKSYSFDDAKYWLTQAANNGRISAYYYLGMLHRDSTLSEAAHYFKKGAEKGDENCMRMLENPDFIDVNF